MNRQINPDHSYESEDGSMYRLAPTSERDSPEWWVLKDGRHYQTFTSLAAAKGWLEHVLQYPQSDRRPA